MAKTSGQLEKERIRKRNEIVITDLSTCYFCKSTGLAEADVFCPNCAFPQRGTQNEKQKFVWGFKNKQFILADQKKAINKARIFLFILAGVNFLSAVLTGFIFNPDILNFIVYFIISLAYLGLALWCIKKPFPAILSGFFVYIVVLIIFAVADPFSLVRGLIWKVVVIGGFVYGYRAALQSDKLEKELQSLKKAENFKPADELL